MPLEDLRAGIGHLDDERRHRQLVEWIKNGLVALLLVAGVYLLFFTTPAIRTGVERTDCARAIADETSRLDRAADRKFREIVVFAFRLPQGSPVTTDLATLVDELEAADDELERRPLNQVLVERTCPG